MAQPPFLPRSETAVLVLGAGLTGMAAAHQLKARGVPFRLLERLEKPGGHVVTSEEDGYRFDRTGHLLHLRDPEMRAKVLGWIGDHVEVQRSSVVWSHGRYTRYPYQANTFGLPPEVAYACLKGFIDAHFASNKPVVRNFEEFCLVHFGKGISDNFMIPYNTKLWGASPQDITADWCSRFVPLPKLDDVLAGAVGKNDRELGYNASFLYPTRGIQALTDGMARELGDCLELSRALVSIDPVRREVALNDEVIHYQMLISTMPMSSLLALCQGLPEAVAQAASQLVCNPLYYLDVALNEPAGKPYHWVYVPEMAYPFYRVGCYSNFSKAMAPPGKAGLYVELASRQEPNLDSLLPEVTAGLVQMGYVSSARGVRFARLRRIDHAYVVFNHAYYPALSVIGPYLEGMQIRSTGRYGGWNYSSMEDALIFGRDAAIGAIELLHHGQESVDAAP